MLRVQRFSLLYFSHTQWRQAEEQDLFRVWHSESPFKTAKIEELVRILNRPTYTYRTNA